MQIPEIIDTVQDYGIIEHKEYESYVDEVSYACQLTVDYTGHWAENALSESAELVKM